MKRKQIIAPQSAAAFRLLKGEDLKVIDLEGGQVADLLFYKADDLSERFSTGATIDNNGSLYIKIGDCLFSNKYNPLMKVLKDTVGAHDFLHPPCSQAMYAYQYGIRDEHPSCYSNFLRVLGVYGLGEQDIVNPFNIFMNTRVDGEGRVEVKAPLSQAGDYISFQAMADLIVAVTACSVQESACNAYHCSAIGIEICRNNH